MFRGLLLVNHQFHYLHTFLDNCAIVFTHCTLVQLLSSCISYRQPLSVSFTSWLYQAVPMTVCWSGCLQLLPDVCPLVVICALDDGLFPLCMNTAAAAAATPHTTMILCLRSLRPVGFCPFMAGKCLYVG